MFKSSGKGGFVAGPGMKPGEVPAILAHGDDNRRKPARERAARALCRRDGHPENITFEGKPMWMSYLDTVDLVLEAAGITGLHADPDALDSRNYGKEHIVRKEQP